MENTAPAAVMNQPSDASFKFDDDGSLYTPTGMAVADEDICRGFDSNCNGEYGLIKTEKDKIKSLKGSEIVSEKMFRAILEHSQHKIKEMAQNVYSGRFDNTPLEMSGGRTGCDYCGYRAICRKLGKTRPMEKADFTKKEDNADGGKTMDSPTA